VPKGVKPQIEETVDLYGKIVREDFENARKYLVKTREILGQETIKRYEQSLPEAKPVYTNDEIGELKYFIEHSANPTLIGRIQGYLNRDAFGRGGLEAGFRGR
jgi:hypothetical protein